MPAISASASGVSITRSGPKRRADPAVARKTPPSLPTSSPSTTTSASSLHRAREREVDRLNQRDLRHPALPPRRVALARCSRIERRGRGRVQVVEHAVGGCGRRVEVGLDRRSDLLVALLQQRCSSSRLVPRACARQVIAQAQRSARCFQRRSRPRRVAIARRIVGGRVVGQAIGERFDQRRPVAGARFASARVDDLAHGDHVVAVDLLARECRRRSPSARASRAAVCALRGTEIAHWLLLTTNTTGSCHTPAAFMRLVEVAFGRGAVADHADGDARLAPQLDRVGDAGRMRRLACRSARRSGKSSARAR